MLRMVPLPIARRWGGTDAVQHLREFDRILERQLGARADREMRGMRGVAEQNDVAGIPPLALDPPEIEPGGRADEMGRVGLQAMALEIFGEQLFAGGDAVVLRHR